MCVPVNSMGNSDQHKHHMETPIIVENFNQSSRTSSFMPLESARL
jgi:hypothetical protein